MNWVWLLLAIWLPLALVVGLGIGRAVWLADRLTGRD